MFLFTGMLITCFISIRRSNYDKANIELKDLSSPTKKKPWSGEASGQVRLGKLAG